VSADDNMGRRRFSLGHEIAHWICDASNASFMCANTDIGPQNAEARTVEASANSYASQLLLPDYLVRPWLGSRLVNLDLAQALANDFQASLTASAIKLARRSAAPAVVACHDQSRLRWFQKNLVFPLDLYVRAQLHQDTVAFDMVFGAASGMSRPKREPANRWLNGSGAYRQTVSSQSVKLPDGTALTLIAIV
jgi:hypothetical protein